MGWVEGLNSEDHPRNAAALRTAVLLGAVFELHKSGQWTEATIEGRWRNRVILAYLFLAKHGVGIDENGSPSTRMYDNVPRSKS